MSSSQIMPDAGIEVRTAASPEHLSTFRAVAADLAMRQDMNLDMVADLRLAVDEACSTLVRLAADGSLLTCTFHPAPGVIRLCASVRSTSADGPAMGSFSWQVLSTLTEEAHSEVLKEDDGYLVRIEISKRETGAT